MYHRSFYTVLKLSSSYCRYHRLARTRNQTKSRKVPCSPFSLSISLSPDIFLSLCKPFLVYLRYHVFLFLPYFLLSYLDRKRKTFRASPHESCGMRIILFLPVLPPSVFPFPWSHRLPTSKPIARCNRPLYALKNSSFEVITNVLTWETSLRISFDCVYEFAFHAYEKEIFCPSFFFYIIFFFLLFSFILFACLLICFLSLSFFSSYCLLKVFSFTP